MGVPPSGRPTVTLSLSGEPAPIAEGLFSTSAFSVSENGTLSYQTGALVQPSQLLWLDRSGKVLGTQGKPDNYAIIALSPDGQRLAALVADPDDNYDIWVEDLTRRTRTRLTFDSLFKDPVGWSADGRRVIYGSIRAGHVDIYARDASGAGDEETLVRSEDEKWPTGCSRDGQWLAYTRRGTKPDSKMELWTYSFATRQAVPLLQAAYDEGEGSFSPDGRWITYYSSETGRSEVYVRPFPGRGGKWQVSNGDGGSPFWSRSGREILFVGADGGLWSADVTLSAQTLEAAPPKRLLPVSDCGGFGCRPGIMAAPDGNRFLVAKPLTDRPPPSLIVVLNWLAGLKK
jgi:Tol biopolymer transport system component